MFGRVAATIGTFLFPGYGHAVVGRRKLALGWTIAVPLAVALTLVSVWMSFVAVALRVLSAVHASWVLRRAERIDWLGAIPMVVVVTSIVTFAGMRALVIEGYKAPSSSMCPTIAVGDHVWVDLLSTKLGSVGRGDVIVFLYPCDPGRHYLKRVIALAGDT